MKRKRSTFKMSNSSNHCCIKTDGYWKERLPSFLWKIYLSFYEIYNRSSLFDSPPSIIFMQLKEMIEIGLQTIAFYYYAGSQSDIIKWLISAGDNPDDVVFLAERLPYISLFCYILSIDCIFLGILWCLYIFKHSTFHGAFFRYLVFSIDFIFDMFCATFPLLIIGYENDNNFNFITAAGAVNTNGESVLIFIATLIPIIYVVIKLSTILQLISQLATKQFSLSFRRKTFGYQDNHDDKNDKVETDMDANDIHDNRVAESKPGDIEIIENEMRAPDVVARLHSNSTSLGGDNDNINTLQNTTSTSTSTRNRKIKIELTTQNLCCFGKKYIENRLDTIKDNEQLLTIQYCRRITTLLIAVLAIVWGIALASIMLHHITYRVNVCDDYNLNELTDGDGIDAKHAHLYVWKYCKFRVYPIEDEIPCQCRNMQVYSNETTSMYDTLISKLDTNTSSEIMSTIFKSALKKYYMLETFRFHGVDYSYMNNITFDDDMTVAKKLKVLYLRSIEINTFASNFGNDLPSLEFLQLAETYVIDKEMNTDSWANLKELKYFDIGVSTFRVKNLDWLCHLTNLKHIALSSVGLKEFYTLPQCLVKLINLKQLYTEYASYFPIEIALLPKLVYWDCNRHNVNASIIEKQLNTLTNESLSINSILNNIEEKHIYFQSSMVCDEYFETSDKTSFYAKYPLTYDLIVGSDICVQRCDDAIGQALCTANWYHDGECQGKCNISSCGYDGGDCTQLCDFSVCNYTALGDGICNPECHNKECSFDYCDCFIGNDVNVSDAENKQCNSYNATSCDLNSDCMAISINTSDSWVGDLICDEYCNNDYCNFDNGDCLPCDDGNDATSGTGCSSLFAYFRLVSDFETEDDKISLDELCEIWPALSQFIDIDQNCTQWFNTYDLNNDTFLNGYEGSVGVVVELENDIDRALQVNCSLCWPSVEVYYI